MLGKWREGTNSFLLNHKKDPIFTVSIICQLLDIVEILTRNTWKKIFCLDTLVTEIAKILL